GRTHQPFPVDPRPPDRLPTGDPMMERRTFLGTLGLSVLAAPLAAEAQQARKVWIVGLFSAVTSTSAPPDILATPYRSTAKAEMAFAFQVERHENLRITLCGE